MKKIFAVVALSLRLDSGLDVAIAASGADALRYLEKRIPDLVVLDVMMPGLDGPGTLLQMRERPGDRGRTGDFLAKVRRRK